MFEISRISDDTIALSGRFDASQVKKATEFLAPVDCSITFDLADLDYISSAGLGVLVATYKRLDQSGKTVKLKNLSGHIQTVFKFSGLDRIFQIIRD